MDTIEQMPTDWILLNLELPFVIIAKLYLEFWSDPCVRTPSGQLIAFFNNESIYDTLEKVKSSTVAAGVGAGTIRHLLFNGAVNKQTSEFFTRCTTEYVHPILINLIKKYMSPLEIELSLKRQPKGDT